MNIHFFCELFLTTFRAKNSKNKQNFWIQVMISHCHSNNISTSDVKSEKIKKYTKNKQVNSFF